jgi:protein involved in polysaccharide export with SLBB domain
MKWSRLAPITLVALALAGGAHPALAQERPRVAHAEGLHHTRQELHEILNELDRTAAAPGASGEMRQHARSNAARIRQRLEEGDFRAGDRIHLEVRGEEGMSGEFTVEPGPTVTLPDVGAISLAGVLRSELEDHLRGELRRFLQNPAVQARSLIRLAVLGEIGNPGFFTLPASLVLEDVVMTAGGPTRNANLDRIRIERAGETIWRDAVLQQAMLDSRTLDQLSLQAGDRIIIPGRSTPLLSPRGVFTVVTTTASLLYLYLRIRRVF